MSSEQHERIPAVSLSPPLNALTAKQQEILQFVGRGFKSKQIAMDLDISVRTVEAHKYTIMQILDVHSTPELVRKAQALGLTF